MTSICFAGNRHGKRWYPGVQRVVADDAGHAQLHLVTVGAVDFHVDAAVLAHGDGCLGHEHGEGYTHNQRVFRKQKKSTYRDNIEFFARS